MVTRRIENVKCKSEKKLVLYTVIEIIQFSEIETRKKQNENHPLKSQIYFFNLVIASSILTKFSFESINGA
jgi:hypothetical protein